MKAFFKKVLTPRTLFIVLLLLEVLALLAVWGFLEFGLDYLIDGTMQNGFRNSDAIGIGIIIGARVILTLISLIVLLKIINREENPEYKIPWLTFLFLFPIIVLTFYLIFVRKKVGKKEAPVVVPTQAYLREKEKEWKEEYDQTIEGVDPIYQGVFNYLHTSTHLSVSKNNRLTYYKNGEEFFPDFIESLEKAKKFIFVQFFILAEGKWLSKTLDVLKRKAKEGVEVRLIYDDIGSNGTVPDDLPEQLQKEGISCHKFHPFSPLLSRSINNRDHRKIVVIDHQIAFTGGMNLADEYANDKLRFGYWKDTMVKVEGKGIRDLIATFLQNYDLTVFTLSNYDSYLDGDDYPVFEDSGYAFSFGDGPGQYTSYEQIGEQNYINLLNLATKRVDISTPYLLCTYPLLRAVTAAAKRGVEVNLFVPGIPDKKLVYWMAKCEFRQFLKAGVHLYIYKPGFNHEKQMLVDDRLCFCGTINFDFRSLTHHFEDGITFLDAPCMKEIREDFDEMKSVSEEVPSDFTVPTFQTVLCSFLKVFRALL